MATLDELLVRLDADTTPLQKALTQADRLIKDFAAAADRHFEQPSRRLAGLVGQGGGSGAPSSAPGGRTRFAVSEGKPGSTEVLFPVAGKLLLDILVSVGTGVATSLITETLLSDDFDPVGELFKDSNFDPNRITDAVFEFQARFEDLLKAAGKTTAEERIQNESAPKQPN